MSDQWWAVFGLCWVHVGPMLVHVTGFMCSMEVSGGGNDRIIRILMMRSFLWVSVGPMLGCAGSTLGLCLVIWWAM